MGVLNFVMRHETDACLVLFCKKLRALGVKLYQLPSVFCVGRTELIIARSMWSVVVV